MDFDVLRRDMVDSLEHETKGVVSTPAVAEAFRAVPRHEFVPEGHRAYLDKAFENDGSRVLAPSTAARLLEALEPTADARVLIVGAGVGYTAALLAEIADGRQVQALDISRELVYTARENLASAGYEDVLVNQGDGAEGLPSYAPFDRILVEAAAVEAPPALLDQLADGGRLVLPRGVREQTLVAHTPGGLETFGPTALDPLLVDGEQAGAIERNRTRREEAERAQRAADSRSGWEQEWIDWEERR
ncbi:MAG: protein-L-isoaspartate O-methyltransferase [Halobacteriaceae archaeon]